MEEFKKKLQKRVILYSCALCFAGAAVLLTRNFKKELFEPEHIRDFMDGFQLGFFIGLFSVLMVFLIKTIIAIRKPEKLKKLYISETDERNLLILQKSGSSGMNIAMYGLAVAAAIAGNFNYTVFFTLLSAAVFVTLIRLIFKLYYHKKY